MTDEEKAEYAIVLTEEEQEEKSRKRAEKKAEKDAIKKAATEEAKLAKKAAKSGKSKSPLKVFEPIESDSDEQIEELKESNVPATILKQPSSKKVKEQGQKSPAKRQPKKKEQKSPIKKAVINSAKIDPFDASIYQLQANGEKVETTFRKVTRNAKLIMVVNTADEPNNAKKHFEDMVDLQRKYGGRGLQILAFPSDSFDLEKRSDEEIFNWAKENYDLNLPIFSKVAVNEENTHPIYVKIKSMVN